ncbi:hypothetical protein MUK42_35399 [Musa troglodytarum]|uniref:Uncharacterized protein n=1 Tax=Musa troglodytarum TaxID=320322 RepID=A0A9E7JUI7_9LILI|nr:hypothetical protein MUK42_35399 [Musa troglodytarum]
MYGHRHHVTGLAPLLFSFALLAAMFAIWPCPPTCRAPCECELGRFHSSPPDHTAHDPVPTWDSLRKLLCSLGSSNHKLPPQPQLNGESAFSKLPRAGEDWPRPCVQNTEKATLSVRAEDSVQEELQKRQPQFLLFVPSREKLPQSVTVAPTQRRSSLLQVIESRGVVQMKQPRPYFSLSPHSLFCSHAQTLLQHSSLRSEGGDAEGGERFSLKFCSPWVQNTLFKKNCRKGSPNSYSSCLQNRGEAPPSSRTSSLPLDLLQIQICSPRWGGIAPPSPSTRNRCSHALFTDLLLLCSPIAKRVRSDGLLCSRRGAEERDLEEPCKVLKGSFLFSTIPPDEKGKKESRGLQNTPPSIAVSVSPKGKKVPQQREQASSSIPLRTKPSREGAAIVAQQFHHQLFSS